MNLIKGLLGIALALVCFYYAGKRYLALQKEAYKEALKEHEEEKRSRE